MPAAEYDFVIEQGTTVKVDFIWKDDAGNPIDITGYTARMQARPNIASATVLLDLTTVNTKIVLGGATGSISIRISDTETAALTWTSAVYDLEVVSGTGTVTRLIKGAITVDPEVTRS